MSTELPPRPLVITFLKMSAKSKDFDAEADDANEIVMSLICSEVKEFQVLDAIVKKATKGAILI